MQRPYNNLFLTSYGAIGDFVMHLPLLSGAHTTNPGMRIVVLTTRGAPLLREISAAYPFIRVVPLWSWEALLLWTRTVLQRNIYIIQPSFYPVPKKIAWVAKFFTLGGVRAGYKGREWAPPYDISTPFNPQELFYTNLRRLFSTLGFENDENPRVSFIEDVSALQSIGSRYIVLAPFASNPGKTLPMHRWSLLLTFLADAYSSIPIAIVGGPTDVRDAEALLQSSAHPHGKVLCNLPFAQTAALLSHTALFIGADSGLTHCAGLLHVPSVLIENLRTVTWLPTYNPNAIILTEKKNCLCGGDKTGDCNYMIDGVSYLRCMYDVSDERIRTAVSDVLNKKTINT